MGLESATFITDLVDTNPVASDQRSQGDDHLRLLKTILRATFPNASRAFYFPDTQVKTSNFTIAASDQRKLVEGYQLQEKNKEVRLALDWALYRMGRSEMLYRIVDELDSGRQDQAIG